MLPSAFSVVGVVTSSFWISIEDSSELREHSAVGIQQWRNQMSTLVNSALSRAISCPCELLDLSFREIPAEKTQKKKKKSGRSNRYLLVKQICSGQTALSPAADSSVTCCQQICHLLPTALSFAADSSVTCCQQICHLLPIDLSLAANRFRHWLSTDFVTGCQQISSLVKPTSTQSTQQPTQQSTQQSTQL
ncbi:hypothetical protein F511_37228 [Dorcoceras hygrometricum]|uniref:Uncharacterized protein n=1 Tax=Dorcoceras hygrometricum TaxID=472368 RepID=A0A2Z7CF57_9LAMI|nr:hypothetical protein F511_37228 [Dorcoceras hygrometricum]